MITKRQAVEAYIKASYKAKEYRHPEGKISRWVQGLAIRELIRRDMERCCSLEASRGGEADNG